MKFQLLSLTVLSLATSAFAAEKVTISGVHNCCKKCADGITKAVNSAPGASATVAKSSVTIAAASAADLQKAADALIAAGYIGDSDNSAVKLQAPAAPDEKVSSVTVSGAHLCCGKCVNAAEKAINAVAGVKNHTATKGADTFKVEGDFNAKALSASLAKAGFAGKIVR